VTFMSAEQLRVLIEEAYNAHKEFKREWNNRSGNPSRGTEPAELTAARDKFWRAHTRLFGEKLDPLRAAFAADTVRNLDEVIDFLAIDVPAFRTGYEKEWYLGKLKSVPLTGDQKERLKDIALDLAGNPNYRRELRDWARLMILLADEGFVTRLRIMAASTEHSVQQNSGRMLRTILENRRDLANIAKAS
jgi:hypothetical protein